MRHFEALAALFEAKVYKIGACGLYSNKGIKASRSDKKERETTRCDKHSDAYRRGMLVKSRAKAKNGVEDTASASDKTL